MPSLMRRGITQRARKKYKKPISHSKLFYLGNGSYGTVYEIYGSDVALKEHRIAVADADMDAVDGLCNDWKKEYDMNLAIYNKCNRVLHKYFINIVRPFEFSYARREQNKFVPLKLIEGATSCFYTMERVPGLASSNDCFLNKLYTIIKPDVKLPSTEIPPYMCLGTLVGLRGHISLDMMIGTRVIEFPNEALNYCLVDSIGLEMMRNMFLSFFIIAESGYMPRDIEYVFNGACTNTYCSVLDFNEVMTLGEREGAYGRDGYNVEKDFAHVYIDLCGLRSSRDVNPFAPYDSPTPQWKFLCNPLVSPYAFFEMVAFANTYGEFASFCLFDVVREILSYAEKRNLKSRISNIHKALWKPNDNEFSASCGVEFTEFDMKLQMYFIYSLLETCEKRKVLVSADEVLGKSYKEVLAYLLGKLEKSDLDMGDDWGFMLDGLSPTKNPVQNNAPFVIKQRRYTLRALKGKN